MQPIHNIGTSKPGNYDQSLVDSFNKAAEDEDRREKGGQKAPEAQPDPHHV